MTDHAPETLDSPATAPRGSVHRIVGRILVACEYSGTVRDSFAAAGWDAWSCDFEKNETPGNHVQCDVTTILNQGWDMMIAHPPCERICVSGARWKYEKPGWTEEQEAGLALVKALLEAPIPKIALENPVGIISTRFRPPDQVLQPWMFGIPETKATCLWLKGLPPLQATHRKQDLFCPEPPENIVARVHKLPPGPMRKKLRAWKYKAIAEAMANQWTPAMPPNDKAERPGN